MSEYFLAANGVKQGAVMSPVLFCVYIDELLISISKVCVGCYIGGFFVGAFAYTDDVVIVAPSATALRRLLTICDEYAREYSIAFNAAKSNCLIILPSKCRWLQPYVNNCKFFIGNEPIELANSFCHPAPLIPPDGWMHTSPFPSLPSPPPFLPSHPSTRLSSPPSHPPSSPPCPFPF
jgi:hypothetical protein